MVANILQYCNFLLRFSAKYRLIKKTIISAIVYDNIMDDFIAGVKYLLVDITGNDQPLSLDYTPLIYSPYSTKEFYDLM